MWCGASILYTASRQSGLIAVVKCGLTDLQRDPERRLELRVRILRLHSAFHRFYTMFSVTSFLLPPMIFQLHI